MNSSLLVEIAESRQLILVATSGWGAVDGEMTLYERDSINDQWKAVGEKIPIVVGRNGMAWGKGLHGGVIGVENRASGSGAVFTVRLPLPSTELNLDASPPVSSVEENATDADLNGLPAEIRELVTAFKYLTSKSS